MGLSFGFLCAKFWKHCRDGLAVPLYRVDTLKILMNMFKQWLNYLILISGLLCFNVHAQEQEATADTGEATEETAENSEPDASEAEEKKSPPAVYLAAKQGRLEKLKRLIAEGMDINQANATGRTPLMAAVFYRNRRVVEELLAEGADVDAVDGVGRTALMMAINREDKDIIMLLINAGADVGIADKKEKTALMMAENLNDKDLKKLIESAGSQ